ncbi:hypothetical protein [Legionella hackeliae]|uniref:Uncharacterized protein n=1 Tax=Legionella hackeliae TaxID=449 RepID=A0A0A8UMY7_LEGHA|nr:hypothetical protein [Legionella hackeliae]KTD10588.1 hypothetical protein Lhac_2956 [Legionella hackeliae]CEK10093.1 protein of unknown function [Legionella hackeliae]STX46818.1 Uncharacterised protein [Legionella hackeliae]
MDEKEQEALEGALEEIKKSIHPFLLPTDKLTKKVSHFSELASTVEFLTQADRHLKNSNANHGGLLAVQDIPFREIFSLLKDCYSGKINDHLQSLLESAEVELNVKKRDPNNPQSPKQLEIKIELAAAVIDKYADLLTMVIGKKSKSKDEQVIIKNASTVIDDSAKKLRRIHLMYGISQLEQEVYHCIDEHSATHCLPFFCTGKTISQYKALAAILNNLLSEPLSASELAGGIYTVRLKLQSLPDLSVQRRLTTAMNQVLKTDGYPVEEKEAEKFIQIYQTRMEQINSVTYDL